MIDELINKMEEGNLRYSVKYVYLVKLQMHKDKADVEKFMKSVIAKGGKIKTEDAEENVVVKVV